MARASVVLKSLGVVGSFVGGLSALPAGLAADRIDIGGSLGARIFADKAQLGAFDPAVPALAPTVVLVPRATWFATEWLWVEGELALAPTDTKTYDVDVLWFAPRALATWHRGKGAWQALVSLGGEMPVALSDKGGIFESDLSASGLLGLGAAWRRERLLARFEVRHAFTLAREPDVVASEWEFLLGLSYDRRKPKVVAAPPPPPADKDKDGIVDDDDKCPARAEDKDSYQDADGCPDIDNDLDTVLDDADKCQDMTETLNGFDDLDGCPDTLPSEFERLIGTIAGIKFSPGSDDVRGDRKWLEAIAVVMKRYPGANIVLFGHVSLDEVEDEDGKPDALKAERLGRARAEAIRAELMIRGVREGRMRVDSLGEELVSGEITAPSEGEARRVELQMAGQ